MTTTLHPFTSRSTDGTHLSTAAEAGHAVALAQVVEAGLGELTWSYDGESPRVERVQAVLLFALAGVVARWSLVGHVLYAPRAERAGGRWSREAHVEVTNRLFTLAHCRVRSRWARSRKLQEKGKKIKILLT